MALYNGREHAAYQVRIKRTNAKKSADAALKRMGRAKSRYGADSKMYALEKKRFDKAVKKFYAADEQYQRVRVS